MQQCLYIVISQYLLFCNCNNNNNDNNNNNI